MIHCHHARASTCDIASPRAQGCSLAGRYVYLMSRSEKEGHKETKETKEINRSCERKKREKQRKERREQKLDTTTSSVHGPHGFQW